MKKNTFKCKTITPMFMFGADGKTLELRPSEFKGMMRFWWRAVKAEDDIEQLRKKEAEIFGGTGEGEGRSKVRIRVLPNWISSKFIGGNFRDEIRSNTYDELDGLSYLMYSTFTLKIQGERLIKKYIKPGFEFKIMLSSFDEENLKNALSSIWLSIFLGGFGTRARRGGGNLEITNIEGETYNLDFMLTANNKYELKNWMEENIKKIRNIIHSSSETSKYSNLTNSKILIFDPKNSWKEALNLIGLEFKEFRKNNKDKLWEMAAFGMPVMHRGFKVRMVPYKDNKRLSERLSSPLIIKIIKAKAKDLYFPVIVKLNYEIGRVGKEGKPGRNWIPASPNNIKNVNFKKIEEFLDFMKKENNCVEVNL